MADYHFVSIWQINAPIERAWEEIRHAGRWPSWRKYIVGEPEPGAADGGRQAPGLAVPDPAAVDARL
jgi:hypothetical protein